MSKAEIIAELPRLKPDELAEIQAKLDELPGTAWQDGGKLSETDKHTLDQTIAAYEAAPDAGGSLDDVRARVLGKLRR